MWDKCDTAAIAWTQYRSQSSARYPSATKFVHTVGMWWWVAAVLGAWLLVSVAIGLVLGKVLRVADMEESLVEFQRAERESERHTNQP